VELALKNGFRSIDTACQPKHYSEKGVGDGIQAAIASGIVTRNELFIQTKFTPIGGQDPHNVPYNPNDPLAAQVQQSLQKSLENLQTDYIDSLVLHSPLKRMSDTLVVWREFETAVRNNLVKYIGISNCYDINVLKELYETASIKPTFLQNRFYKETEYDADIREYCKDRDILYQTFWTLTGNPRIIQHRLLQDLASKYGKTPAQIWFRFVNSHGHIFLTGTKDPLHMKQDLEVPFIELTAQEIQSIGALLT